MHPMVCENSFGLRVARFALLLLMPFAAACASMPSDDYQIPPPAPGSYFTVRVQSGDTVSELAYRYQVGEDDVLALNDLYDRNALPAGGRVRIPAYGHLRDSRRGETATPRPRDGARDEYAGRIDTAPLYDPSRTTPRPAQRQPVTRRPLEPARTAEAVPVPRQKPEQDRDQIAAVPPPVPAQSSWFGSWFTPDPQPAPQPAAAGAQRLLWPVNGRVISNFGQSRTGERNDGINISAPLGAPVRSADAGTVSYVGNELKGYGNLVLIKHDNGAVTAYAHAQSVTVQRGERVARGQVIAYAGETGDVTQPQVHFELRVNAKPVDPRPYLMASN
jgi:murein DD-endopeptidase MepM/ murein hydrolase activator NlpD